MNGRQAVIYATGRRPTKSNKVVFSLWCSGKDLVPAFATFILCLGLGVELGILVGVGINMVFLVYPSARPALHVERAKVLINNINSRLKI